VRDFVTWGTAVLFLLAALYTVTVRREVVTLGRQLGELNCRIDEQVRQNANLELEAARLRSPAALRLRAEELGVRAGK